MITDERIQALGAESQRSLLALCTRPVIDSAAASSFVSGADHRSGFFSATLARPDADPAQVIAQAERVASDAGRENFVWAAPGTELGVAAWQHGLTPAYSLAVMSREPGRPVRPRPPRGVELVPVEGPAAAGMFRSVHLRQFATAPDPAAAVQHFAADAVLLDPSVQALVVLDGGQPAAAGYLHSTGSAAGIYWVATVADHRRRGLGGLVTDALLDAAPVGVPVVLQATRAGRPVYLRRGFRDHGLVTCWATAP